MSKIRALVVEDSPTVRRRLCDVLSADPDIEVVAEGEDGQHAIELCEALRPDVITLDMQLPTVSGLTATEHIMAHFPTPILIVSASTNRGDLFNTYDALAAGAVDVLEKPRGDELFGVWEAKFLASVKLVSRIRVITHLRARHDFTRARAASRAPAPPPTASSLPAPASAPPRPIRYVALGASTGGPSALVQVLGSIPTHLSIAILVVLHIDEPFGAAFADWLDQQTPHKVVHAIDGAPLLGVRNQVILAPPGRHLVADGARLYLTDAPERHSCRPSIDVLFESLARSSASETLACLLTGMGRDGAAGLLELRRAGALTIAQDEASSTVYGMPREAALLGAAERVLPLASIGRAIADSVEARAEVSK